jgi:hypothetical protein
MATGIVQVENKVSAYKSESKKYNYANVEMRVKALKMYFGIKQG